MKKFFLILLFLMLALKGFCDDLTIGTTEVWPTDCGKCLPPCAPCEERPCVPNFESENIVVDLIDPVYENGVLTTTKGGILIGPHLRIQARNITYIRNLEAPNPVYKVICDGDLLIDYKDRTLAGKSIEYDFLTHSGMLIDGRTSMPPWQIGGEQILLHDEGKLTIYNGYLKTTEGNEENWNLLAPKITVFKNKIISADNISIRFSKVPVFWMPKIKLDLKKLGHSPVAVRANWGGFMGSRLSLRYLFFSWNDFDAYARIDGYLKRGLGGGIETEYASPCNELEFYTRNYYAHDISIDSPERRDRYRFEGTLCDLLFNDWISAELIYDKVSDPDMAADYQAKDFDLLTAGRTQLELHTETDNWIADLFTKVRVNSFQTVNQELPSFLTTYHPFEIAQTGLIVENLFRASYYDYVFGEEVVGGNDFHSARLEARPAIYRPIDMGPFTVTPKAGLIGIAYSNSPNEEAVGQVVGELGLNINTSLYQTYDCYKHVIEPYAEYRYLTPPKVPVDHYFVFDIRDAYTQLNQMRLGVRQSLFIWDECVIVRPFFLDLFTYAFFATPTISTTFQKFYANLEWFPLETILLGIDTAWNFEEGALDHYNFRTEWTYSENLALAMEYRHRSAFDWRKADMFDFILDSARSEQELLDSPLSDRRDTLLGRLFYRFHPDWNIKFQIRHGWGRRDQPNFTEYQSDLGTILNNHLRVNFIYDKRESDHRFSVSLKLDQGPRKLRR